ncbi:MAG: heme-copper oxidase subunit III [Pseudomonadota bacterium]
MSGSFNNTGSAAATEARGIGRASAGTIGMWVFLATDAMGFGGLLLAYAVLRARAGTWPDPSVRFDRSLAAGLTFVLLFSGATMTATLVAAREGKRRTARLLLALTVLAGLAFVAGQAAEFHALAQARHVGLTADHAAALFYVITGYHGLHVLVGVLVLALVGLRHLGGRASAGAPAAVDHLGLGALGVASLFWQFVDVVWIVIFTILYLLPVARG